MSILQGKIDRLERLLAENNEIITNIRDSVINLKESVKDGVPGGGNMSQGPYPELLASPPLVLPIDSQDCQFAAREFSEPADGVQVRLLEKIRNSSGICRCNAVVGLNIDLSCKASSSERLKWTKLQWTAL